MKFFPRKVGAVAALAVATALVATGCSSGSGDSDAEPVEELTEMTTISVATLPIAPSAALLLGIEQGIFEEHNLDVELSSGQGGAAILPAVSTGQLNFAIGQPLPIILAASKGVDVQIVTNYAASYAEGDDINGVAALDESIQSPKDLEGKRVAVNTVKAAGDLTIMEAVDADGGDSSTIEWVEIPFPDMQAQMTSGAVDAIWVPEPFLGKTIREGGHLVTYNYQDTIPGLTTLVGFTSGAYAEENPAVVKAFKEALDESTTYAKAHTEEAQATLIDFLSIPEAAAMGTPMEDFGPDLAVGTLEDLAALMVKYEFMEDEFDVNSIIMEF